MLRHTLATLAYRGGKALRGAPPEFAAYRCAPGTRTPGEILAHIGDLMDWALTMADGAQKWQNSPPAEWDAGSARFFEALERLDARLASPEPLGCTAEQLFQGPIADALTHVGQINLLRRLAGSPVKGENYAKAAIAAGSVGVAQPAPRLEFD
jgi:hypothetical protein